MKKTLISIALIAATSALADIGPDTIMDNVPGDATVRQVVEAGGGGSGGSSVPGGYDDATNKAYLAYASVGRKLDSKKLSWYSDDELDFDTSQPDGGLFFRDSWENIGIGILTDGDYWYIRSAYTDWSWLMNLEGDTLQDKIGEMEFDIRIASMHAMSTNTNPHHVTADQIGAFGAAAGASLQAQVTTIGAHLNAEDARFVVTNYDSVTHTPEAYVEIKLPDNSWSRIWSEMTRWNWLTGTYLPGNFYTQTAIDAKLAEKADRAWGFYDSTTGAYAPDGYTWISSPKIAIAANLAYQRTVTAEGAIWVLESNGTVTETGGMTNGFFRISDDEGNSLFEIVKGDKRTVGADASGCQVVTGFSPTKLQIGYSVVSDVHPTIYVCNSLSTQAWKAEDDADCVANVSWSGSSGAWVAQVQGKSAYSSLFVKATYEVGGETYISNTAPVSMQYLMLNGVKYVVGTATISGHTVLTLTVAQ